MCLYICIKKVWTRDDQCEMCRECEDSGMHWNPTAQDGYWACFLQQNEYGYVHVENVEFCPKHDEEIVE